MPMPYIIARQLAHPKGLVGLVVGRLMNRRNAHMNAFAVQMLDLKPTDRVLEIGFGGGVILKPLLEGAAYLAGIDRSLDMVRRARSIFSTEEHEGRADFNPCSSSRPFWSVNSSAFGKSAVSSSVTDVIISSSTSSFPADRRTELRARPIPGALSCTKCCTNAWTNVASAPCMPDGARVVSTNRRRIAPASCGAYSTQAAAEKLRADTLKQWQGAVEGDRGRRTATPGAQAGAETAGGVMDYDAELPPPDMNHKQTHGGTSAAGMHLRAMVRRQRALGMLWADNES